MKKPLVMGNWKLNGDQKMVQDLIKDIEHILGTRQDCDVVISPPAIYLDRAKSVLKSSVIQLAAQNVDIHHSGAYTGEISANMLKDVGAHYVIIGHSERRTLHNESDDIVAEKFSILKAEGLVPVLCIGETEAENTAGKTEEVCARQLEAVIKREGPNAFVSAVIAYEPVWAIGTGKSATPAQAQAVHKFIRQYITQTAADVAQQTSILYGGSVNDKNAVNFFAQPDINGALVGGASLKAETFCVIVNAAAQSFGANR